MFSFPPFLPPEMKISSFWPNFWSLGGYLSHFCSIIHCCLKKKKNPCLLKMDIPVIHDIFSIIFSSSFRSKCFVMITCKYGIDVGENLLLWVASFYFRFWFGHESFNYLPRIQSSALTTSSPCWVRYSQFQKLAPFTATVVGLAANRNTERSRSFSANRNTDTVVGLSANRNTERSKSFR